MNHENPYIRRTSGDARPRGDEVPEIWVLAEHAEGRVNAVTYEAAAFAVRLGVSVSGTVTVVTLGEAAGALSREIACRTGLAAVGVHTPGPSQCYTETSRWVLKELITRMQPPAFLLAPHTAAGWDLAPALAVDMDASCITGVTGFRQEGDGPVFSRRAFHGKLVEDLQPARDRPAVITVMPGMESAEPPAPERPGEVRLHEMAPPPGLILWVGQRPPPETATRLRDAEVVVAAGRGVGAPEHLAVVRTLAGLFPRGALAASRPLCDMGWLPYDHQVGMTGHTVSPRLYIACGVSGAIQHTQGIRRANLIVSINTDREAPFCGTAHCCVVEDLHTFLPVLIEKIRARRGDPGQREE